MSDECGEKEKANCNPPYQPNQMLTCTNEAPECYWSGDEHGFCKCREGIVYEIDGCVWSFRGGWMVSISGELHLAKHFRPSTSEEIQHEERQRVLRAMDAANNEGFFDDAIDEMLRKL